MIIAITVNFASFGKDALKLLHSLKVFTVIMNDSNQNGSYDMKVYILMVGKVFGKKLRKIILFLFLLFEFVKTDLNNKFLI